MDPFIELFASWPMEAQVGLVVLLVVMLGLLAGGVVGLVWHVADLIVWFVCGLFGIDPPSSDDQDASE